MNWLNLQIGFNDAIIYLFIQIQVRIAILNSFWNNFMKAWS
jgi:hypothetical protein